MDTFDHKPPLLYAVYALGALLPGPPEAGVRALELLTLLGLGALLARLVEPERGALPGPAVALVLVNLHYSTFDWWQSAQSEVWEALFLVAAALAARRASTTRGAALAGALAGVATGFKPPALIVAAAIAGGLLWRTPAGARRRALLGFAAGGFGVGLLLLLPWALAGELRVLWEVLIRYNGAHVASSSGHDPTELLLDHGPMALLMLAVFLVGQACARGPERQARALHGWGLLGLAVTAALSVVAQNKYFPYHFSLILPFLVGLACWGLAAIRLRLAERRPFFARHGAALGWTAALLWSGLALWLGAEARVGSRPPWPAHAEATLRLLRGEISRDLFLAPYRSRHKSAYVVQDVYRLSRVIQERQRPGDTLCVRVYEPGFYTLTGLWCPSRFAVDFPLYDNDLEFALRPAWRREHERLLRRHPPTFMVTIDAKKADREQLSERGYAEVDERGRYVLYERREERPPAAPVVE